MIDRGWRTVGRVLSLFAAYDLTWLGGQRCGLQIGNALRLRNSLVQTNFLAIGAEKADVFVRRVNALDRFAGVCTNRAGGLVLLHGRRLGIELNIL